MNERKAKLNREIQLSCYLDGVLSPDERFQVKERLDTSSEYRETFLKLKAVSSLIHESGSLHLSPEDEKAFDDELTRRLRTLSPRPSLLAWLISPFIWFWELSWQWRVAFAMTIFLVGYIPVVMQTPLDHGANSIPLIDSDYSNCETFFNANPEAGYDLYGVIYEEEDSLKPKKTPTNEERSPVGYFTKHRA